MPNALVRETSPYLRQHAGNPVEWLPWGEAAFAKARSEQKPIFLSSGYSTCHWCHVMEEESFSNPAIAELMNAMRETGADMKIKYKETSRGGLAVNVIEC